MGKYDHLNVSMGGRQVGKLAMYKGRLAAFEYSDEWIAEGFSVSPFSLPLEKRVFIPEYLPFSGLYGIFNDSLPDGWGRLLVDRILLKEHIEPSAVDQLTRLAIVGDTGKGALSYHPEYVLASKKAMQDLDRYSEECRRILESEYSEDLDELFMLGGSSGGARPKIQTEMDGEEWIIKFPASSDIKDIGEIEYRYSVCARKCGIDMPETRLFPSRICSGYFGVKRFDRTNGRRVHMASVSGLLEVSHRVPALDYNTLMALTLRLTKDYSEVGRMYRLMCFNVFAHNRDDHSNNFSFLCDGNGKWRLSPAYDLMYSNSMGGEHATTVDGNGKDPGIPDLFAVGKKIGLKRSLYTNIAEEVQDTVNDELADILNRMKGFAG